MAGLGSGVSFTPRLAGVERVGGKSQDFVKGVCALRCLFEISPAAGDTWLVDNITFSVSGEREFEFRMASQVALKKQQGELGIVLCEDKVLILM